MSVNTAELPADRSRAARAIVWGGLLAGLGDITFAFVVSWLRGVGPVRVLQSVAGGLLGRAAAEGGLATAALGAVLHFFIAFIWATVFWLASRRLTVLVQHPVVCGLLYGVVVYFFMYFVVLPLSAIYFPLSRALSGILLNSAGHALLVGLPIALAAYKFTNKTGRER
ncbi:MAG: hypothetical protein QOH49_2278 [Acidobacteriota bacterium]|jgi:hypothetical protein|nr:hypothetical protein [Acidobacteriota bacterium]